MSVSDRQVRGGFQGVVHVGSAVGEGVPLGVLPVSLVLPPGTPLRLVRFRAQAPVRRRLYLDMCSPFFTDILVTLSMASELCVVGGC